MKKQKSKKSVWSIFKSCLSRFSSDNVVMIANGMVYSSLVALIPCFAFIYSFLSSLGFTEPVLDLVERFLLEIFGSDNGTVLMDYLNRFLNNAMSLGIISFISFFATFLMLIDTLHVTINKLFHCPNKRNMPTRIGKYALAMMVGMLAIALLVTFYTRVLASYISFDGFVTSKLENVSRFLASKAMIYITLYGIYYFLPDCNVSSKSAALGAALGSVLIFLLEYAFKLVVKFSVGKFVIYGSLAALLFFIMFLSWVWRIIFTAAVFTKVLESKDEVVLSVLEA